MRFSAKVLLAFGHDFSPFGNFKMKLPPSIDFTRMFKELFMSRAWVIFSEISVD